MISGYDDCCSSAFHSKLGEETVHWKVKHQEVGFVPEELNSESHLMI